MDKNKNCTVCNIKLDKDNYMKDRIICKSCNIKKKTKNNKNTSHQKPKVLITIALIIEPQTSHEILEFIEVLEFRIPKSTKT